MNEVLFGVNFILAGIFGFIVYKILRRWNELAESVLVCIVMSFFFFIGLSILHYIFGLLANVYIDGQWFADLGYGVVWEAYFRQKITLFLVGFILTWAILEFNQWVIKRYTPELMNISSPRFQDEYNLWKVGSFFVLVLSFLVKFILSFVVGLWSSWAWDEVLLFQNQQPFGQKDPIFDYDIGFYIFTLPFYQQLSSFVHWLFIYVAFFTSALLIYYYLRADRMYIRTRYDFRGSDTDFDRTIDDLTQDIRSFLRNVTRHMLVLVGLYLLKIAYDFWIARYSLLSKGSSQVVNGAGYVDVNIYIAWVYPMMSFLFVMLALVCFIRIFYRRNWIFSGALITFFVISIFGYVFIPGSSQSFVVKPSEIVYETPYISHQIANTRAAYNLNLEPVGEFHYVDRLNPVQLQQNNNTLEQIRVVDWRPLLVANDNLQVIRQYYDFYNTDLARYNQKMYMPSVRELNSEHLPPEAKTWVNLHLTYTHGYGYTVAAVNRVDNQGLPSFVVADIPPSGPGEFKVEHPEIYFGEIKSPWIIVNTTVDEFGKPIGSGSETVRYNGKAGIELGSGLHKLAFAMNLNDRQILLSQFLKADSKIILHRQIKERAGIIAPFLKLDNDPYPVIAGDRVWWVIDAYTTASNYPYAHRSDGYNYIRASVKVVVDAYDGESNFYLMDESDPIIKSWQRAVPGLFKKQAEIPSFLRDHFRYPEDLFNVQSKMLTLYHMDQPTQFYNREDLWIIPSENREVGGNPVEIEGRYVMMRLPNQDKEEFVLIRPFVPNRRENLVAWVAGRSDGENYGKLALYLFPRDKTVLGPLQVEGLINQNDSISKDISLWSQRGSNVFWGNMITLPVVGEDGSGSIIYIKPLYIQADQGKIPALSRVILYHGGQLIYETTLQLALAKLYSGGTPVQVAAPVESSTSPASSSLDKLTKEELYDLIKRAVEELQRR